MAYKIILSLCCLLFLWGARADATTAYHVTDVEQAELSTAVVIAQISTSTTRPHPNHQSIMTETNIVVEEVLYGKAPSHLNIRQIGGTLHGKTLYLPGDARLKEGERCVLFLHAQNGVWYLTALEQSKYRLVPQGRLGWTLERNLSEGLVTRDQSGALAPYVEPPKAPIKRLADFRLELKKLQKGGGK